MKHGLSKKIYIGLSVICIGILFIRTFFSFCGADEPFYLSGGKRLFQGDALLIDEWLGTQFYYPIIEVFIGLYYRIFGGFEGIILAGRLFYLVLSVLICGYLAIALKRRTKLQEYQIFILTILVLFYKRENIEGMSYYNLGLLFCVLALALFLENHYFFSGMAIACTVLCNPYIVIVFFMFLIVLCIERKIKILLQVSGGVIVSAGIYIVWLCLRQDFLKTIKMIPIVMKVSQGHAFELPIDRIKSWIYILVEQNILLVIPAFIYVLVCRFLYIRKKPEISYYIHELFNFYMVIIALYYSVLRLSSAGQIHVIFSICGYAILLSFPKYIKELRVPAFIMIIGTIISLCWHMASDTWDAYRIGFVFSSIGAVLIINIRLKELKERKNEAGISNIIRKVVPFGMVIMATLCIMSRVLYVYRDASLGELKFQIKIGTAKGLFTTEEKKDRYMDDRLFLLELENNYSIGEENTVYFEGMQPWMYLETNARCGIYTTWNVSEYDWILEQYYQIHEYPDYIISDNYNSDFERAVPEGTYDKKDVLGRTVWVKVRKTEMTF